MVYATCQISSLYCICIYHILQWNQGTTFYRYCVAYCRWLQIFCLQTLEAGLVFEYDLALDHGQRDKPWLVARLCVDQGLISHCVPKLALLLKGTNPFPRDNTGPCPNMLKAFFSIPLRILSLAGLNDHSSLSNSAEWTDGKGHHFRYSSFFSVTRVVLIAGISSIGRSGVLTRWKGLHEDMWWWLTISVSQ